MLENYLLFFYSFMPRESTYYSFVVTHYSRSLYDNTTNENEYILLYCNITEASINVIAKSESLSVIK